MTRLELIPAIDLLGGKVVRLRQGRYEDVTVYANDPVDEAKKFQAAGAERLHVVDLDGARDGKPGNLAIIENVVRTVGLAVQVGGGIRNAEAANRWREVGVARVVLGTAAVRAPDMTRSLAAAWPGGVVVAVDAKDGEVQVEGWREGSRKPAVELALEADEWGAAALLYTNIAHDGTGDGPDTAGTAELQRRVRATVIASGGIGSLAHLEALRDAGVRAAVCGRALYEGAFAYADGRRVAEGGC